MANHVKNIILCPDLSQQEALEILRPLRNFNLILSLPSDVWEADRLANEKSIYRVPILSRELDDWRYLNWGTGEPSFRFEEIKGGVSFETFNSHPLPLLVCLFRANHEVLFNVKYADENMGYNLGSYRAFKDKDKNLTIKYDAYTPGSEASCRFACRVWGYDYDEWLEASR